MSATTTIISVPAPTMEIIYWIVKIVLAIIAYYLTYKIMTKIENVKIDQKAETMQDTKGVDIILGDEKNLHIKDMEINQEARQMQNVTGLSVKAEEGSTQSSRLQGVKITQPEVEFVIQNDPNLKFTINNHTIER